MKILIAGASGMVGQALVAHLSKHHQLILCGRDKARLINLFQGEYQYLSWDDLKFYKEPVDVVLHLSGENIGHLPWFASVKQRILNSRVDTAKHLIDWIQSLPFTPHILATNAVGYYGCYEQSPEFTEDSAFDLSKPQGFLQKVAFKWCEVWKSSNINSPITYMHFGVVLQKNAGMLGKLQFSFKLGLGAILGSGKQCISWIDIDDLVHAIAYLIEHPHIQDHINLVSSHPVSQFEFAKTLAQIVNRPLWLSLPNWFIQVVFGEMGRELLLKGQCVYPKKILDAGFRFKYPLLQDSLKKQFEK